MLGGKFLHDVSERAVRIVGLHLWYKYVKIFLKLG